MVAASAVQARGSSPLPSSLALASGGRAPSQPRPHKRSRPPRRRSTLAAVDEVSHEESPASATEASHASQPRLLDFLGRTCAASSAFVNCFPCAVVDINDNDDYIVDKLSRQSAMNVMYQQPSGGGTVGPVTASASDPNSTVSEKNEAKEAAPRRRSVPVLVAEEGSQADTDVWDAISLDDAPAHPHLLPGTPESRDSGLASEAGAAKENLPPPRKGPPQKKKKKFGMKMFGRKNK